MTNRSDTNNPGLKTGDTHHGYTIERAGFIEEIQAHFYALTHDKTGARHFHISNADQENTFSVAFKTVPTDSTGVAHILEHTVLCGSAKYPVRDPFFSMLKRSLSTFMNAFTASDWTMYPFATENRKDYYNLMEVYLDATFYPKLDPLSFKQEGHRLDLAEEPDLSTAERLVYKGVVYNEMKGAMSSPDQVMVRSLMNALYPDTTYHYNSGGDPDVIPSLTYEQLKHFHQSHYHPSNAYFYTYGNLPLVDHLAFVSKKALAFFERIEPHTEVPSQPRWKDPKNVTYSYPLGKNENASKKHQVCIAWLMSDILDSFEVLVLGLLGQILLGNDAAPLRRALIESNLGSALSDGTGFDSDNRDTMFICGLKDVDKSDAGKIESIIIETLKSLAENGIERERIDSAIHQIEFHRKEVTNTPYPYGIKLLMAFAGGWMHGADPETILRLDEDLEKLRRELSDGPFLEDKIRQYFLKNPHRVVFTLSPDQELEEKKSLEVAKELEQLRITLSQDAIQDILADAEKLKNLQDTKEDISVLPTLEFEDIPPDVKSVNPALSHRSAACYDQPTSGIFYFAGAAGLVSLEEQQLPLVPFFCHSLSRIGTKDHDYTEMVRRIEAYTGGIGMGPHARIGFGESGDCIPFISINGKCLTRNQDKMFDIIEELLSRFDFSDTVRLRNLLMEYRAALESMVIHNGHRLAMSLASRNFSSAGTLSENWQGVHQLLFIKQLTDGLTKDGLAAVSNDLAEIGNRVFVAENFKFALIGEKQDTATGIRQLSQSDALSDLGCDLSTPGVFTPPTVPTQTGLPYEGWVTSSSVSFVASAFETVRLAHEDAPALAAAAKLLRSLYLHREIREKGGAYGGFAVYNSENGLFCFGSYRDPHILNTLEIYDRAADFIQSGDYKDEDIKEAVLQVCSEIDKPDPPGPAARKAFYREILSLSDDARRRFKNELLKLNRDRMAAVSAKYFNPGREKAVAVISGEQQLNTANEKMKNSPLTLHVI